MHFLVCIAALPLALGAQPSTKNAIQNLRPDTGNRLAFNRAALPDTGLAARTNHHWEWSSEERRKSCTHLDELKMYFELASDSATSHKVQMEFPGMRWNGHTIKDDPLPGFHEWQAIKIHRPTRLSEIRPRLSILVYQIGRAGYIKHAIRVASIKFRGHCANSDTWIENNRFASLDKTLKMKESGINSFTNGIKFVVWENSLAPTDWVSRPACSHLKQLEVVLQLADRSWAGTENDLYLLVHRSRSLLARDPSRGERFSARVSLMDAFGSSTVALADIKNIVLLNEGEHNDRFLPKEITIQGICDGPSGILLEFKKKMGDWISRKLEVDVDSTGWESKMGWYQD